MRRLIWQLAFVSATPFAATTMAAQETVIDTMAVGRQATEYFLAGDSDSLWTMLTPEFQESLGSPEAILDRLDMLIERAGDENAVLEESIRMRNGRPQYWRVAEFDLAPEPLLLRWVVSPDGKISGQGLGLASQPPKTDD